MSTSGTGRRLAALPQHLPPARREFAHALRSSLEASTFTLRRLAAAAHLGPGTVSRYLSGMRLPSDRTLDHLCRVLSLDETSRSRLHVLLESAAQVGLRPMHETAVPLVTVGHSFASDEGISRLCVQRATPTASSQALLSVFKGLKQKSGLTLSQIAERLNSEGVLCHPPHVGQELRAPGRSLRLSLHIVSVLIAAIPEYERGRARDGLFRILFGDETLGIADHFRE